MMIRQTRRSVRAAAACFLIAAAVVACGEDKTQPEGPSPEVITRAGELTPEDPALAQIYETTCKACHANSDTGAPLTGDKEAWALRLAKGKETLLQNTIDGFKGMPPLGLCMDCTAEEFEALIDFMVEAE